jgi:hypothetical protein
MDWEREVREVKCSSTFVKGMDLSSPAHGLRSLREGCALGKYQEIKIYVTCEASIQRQCEGCADNAWSRY